MAVGEPAQRAPTTIASYTAPPFRMRSPMCGPPLEADSRGDAASTLSSRGAQLPGKRTFTHHSAVRVAGDDPNRCARQGAQPLGQDAEDHRFRQTLQCLGRGWAGHAAHGVDGLLEAPALVDYRR